MEVNKVGQEVKEAVEKYAEKVEVAVETMAHEAKAFISGESPRKLSGLVNGRVVLFVLEGGEVRPMIVVNAGDLGGSINGVLLFDGTNDDGRLPAHVKVRDQYLNPLCCAWVAGVPYSEESVPGSWHWPLHFQSVSSPVIDPQQLRTLLEVELPKVLSFTDVANMINEKLAAHTETVNHLLDSQTDLIKQAVALIRGANIAPPAEIAPEIATAAEPVSVVNTPPSAVADSSGSTGTANEAPTADAPAQAEVVTDVAKSAEPTA